MHETVIAESVFDTVSREAEKQKTRPLKAKITCGRFHTVNQDILEFAFNSLAEGTICQGMKIEVRHKPILAKCRDCHHVMEYDIISAVCEKCGSDRLQLLPDEPLVLEEIEFETEDDNVQS